MASSSHKARVLLGDFALSAKIASISLPIAVDMHDCTVLEDTAKRFSPGQSTSTFDVNGFIDTATAADEAAWTTQQPLTYGPTGLAIGAPVTMVDALRAQYTVGSQVAGVSSFDVSGQADGFSDFGVSLHDLGAETADASATSHDGAGSSTAGAVAHLHCTEFSGLTSIAVIVEDSANNSTWATIGTFATLTAVGGERLEIAGTVRRYVRATWDVTGTGSATFFVGIARR